MKGSSHLPQPLSVGGFVVTGPPTQTTAHHNPLASTEVQPLSDAVLQFTPESPAQLVKPETFPSQLAACDVVIPIPKARVAPAEVLMNERRVCMAVDLGWWFAACVAQRPILFSFTTGGGGCVKKNNAHSE